jgi:hypothetical protein
MIMVMLLQRITTGSFYETEQTLLVIFLLTVYSISSTGALFLENTANDAATK